MVFDSGRELFPSLCGEQWYLTRGFTEMAMFYGIAKRPYWEATAVINRLRYVHTTVAHTATEAGSYVLSGVGAVALLRQMLAFLLANGLAGRSLFGVCGWAKESAYRLVKALGWNNLPCA